MHKDTTKKPPDKPTKPYPDFPLFPHATRRWAKKIKGKLRYFGPWSDPDGALHKYLDQKDDLYAGRTPRVRADGLTVRDLVNTFLTGKRHLVDSSELTPRSFADYHATCRRVVNAFGLNRLVDDLTSDDFEHLRATLAKGWGPVTLGNEIQRVRILFKFASDARLVDRPVHFGPTFKRPGRSVLRLARAQKGPRMFEAHELRAMIDAASMPLKAMMLLGINAGLGNSDVGTLPTKALDLDDGWVNYARPKTGIPRRCPLWPETVAALREALAGRPAPKDPADAGLVFITKYGGRWAKDSTDKPVAKETGKLLRTLRFHRPGVGFYALRHTFQTIGGEARDQVAVDYIMGHDRGDMASFYRERISDERLKAVTGHVHEWLFGSDSDTKKPEESDGSRKNASITGK